MRKLVFKGNEPVIDRDGYKYIPYTDDIDPIYKPMFIKNFAPEHRLRYAQHLKRLLKKEEQVHHKDHNRLNNDLANLELINALEHILQHKAKGNLKLFTKDYQPKRMTKKQSLQKIAAKWIEPDFRKEKLYTKDLINRKGRIVSMTESMWKDIINDPDYKIKTHQSAQKLHKSNGKNLVSTIKDLSTDVPTHTPIVIRNSNGTHKLIAGNTRLLSARYLKKPAKVYLIDS